MVLSLAAITLPALLGAAQVQFSRTAAPEIKPTPVATDRREIAGSDDGFVIRLAHIDQVRPDSLPSVALGRTIHLDVPLLPHQAATVMQGGRNDR